MPTKIVTYLSLLLLLLTSVVPIPALVPTPLAEALTSAMWTHGTSVAVQTPCAAQVTRLGFYTRVDGSGGISCWFHFAIPTTVILSDRRLQIDRVMLNFSTNGARVTSVHVYDGPTRIAMNDNLNLSGDHGFEPFYVPGRPQVNWGIGVSVLVQFSIDPSQILFRTAGVDLY